MKRGAQGEKLAADYLLQNGFHLVERNWRSGRRGEIDIIAYEKGVLVFIEVKDRSRGSWSSPLQAVTRTKRKHLMEMAAQYLYKKELYGRVDCRFDIIGIVRSSRGAAIEHIRDAFRD